MNTWILRFFCLLFGLIFLLFGFYIEQKRKSSLFFNKVKDLISNCKSLDFIIMQIIQNKKIQLPEEFTNCDFDFFIITLENRLVKVFPLKNSRNEGKVSLFQYQALIEKLKNKQTIYTYSSNSISVYHRCAPPIDHCILCIWRQNLSSILGNKNPKLGN